MKKRVILFIITLFLVRSVASADTVLEGKISVEGKKEYQGPVVIKPNTVFTLAKDAELIFKGMVKTDNSKKGDVRFIGVGNSKVRFSNLEAHLTNVYFENLDMTDFTECLINLKNITVDKGKVGLKVTKNTLGNIENIIVRDSEIGFVTELKSKVFITGGQLYNNKTAFVADQAGVAEIKQVNFYKNNIGLVISQDGGVRLFNSNIYDNEGGIFITKHIGSIIQDNNFKNNKIGIFAEYMSNVNIEKNQFLKNEIAIKFFQFVTGRIKGNSFIKNKEAVFIERKCNPDIRYNNFSENEVGVFCDFSSYPTITMNNFLNNQLHIKLGIFQSADFENRIGSLGTQLQEMAAQQSRRVQPADQKKKRYIGEIFAKKNFWDDKTREEMDKRENISTLYDGYDIKDTAYEGFGDEKYKIDIIVWKPYLKEKVNIEKVK